MAIYDEEQLLLDVENLLKAKLNAKILEINTEKNDGKVLPDIEGNAYFYDMDDGSANYNPLVLIAVTEYGSESLGKYTARNVGISVNILMEDDKNDRDIVPKMMRYQRCLREIFEDSSFRRQCSGNFKISALPIFTWTQGNKHFRAKVASIEIETSIA